MFAKRRRQLLRWGLAPIDGRPIEHYMDPVAQPRVIFRFEYVSGGFLIASRPTEIDVFVVNRGSSEEVVRAVVFHRETVKADSDNASPIQGLNFGIVGSRELWGPFISQTDETGAWWVRILTTSANLVPSIEFRRFEGTPRHMTTYASRAPGDFAVFSLPFRPTHPGPDQIPPDGPVIDQ
jgi:hypothetical protein